MDAGELERELAFAVLGGHWSVELTAAIAEVAVAAGTDPRARTLAEDWIRSGTAEQLWTSGTGVEEWVALIGWLEWLDDNELSIASVDSLWASFVAVIEIVGTPPGGSGSGSDPLLEPF